MENPIHEPAQELKKRARRVHCLLGFPIDMVTMDDVLSEISQATRTRHRLFVSTVNLNFVALAQTDQDFRNSLRSSNLCLADGVAVKLIGRLLGMPIAERVAGSDFLNAIWSAPSPSPDQPLKVFFFGGTEEAGQLACETVSRHPSGKTICVGNLCPGFGTIEEMSSDTIIETINRANPDFLIVALGARKGQAWIMRNQEKLQAPIISHLGATINFLAGTVQRAPMFWQRVGLEWLWRIKEEPALGKRYWQDFLRTAQLGITNILPLAIQLRYNQWRWKDQHLSLTPVESEEKNRKLSLKLQVTGTSKQNFCNQVDWSSVKEQHIEIKLDDLNWLSTQSMGCLLLVAELVRKSGGCVNLVGQSRPLSRQLSLNGLGDLLART